MQPATPLEATAYAYPHGGAAAPLAWDGFADAASDTSSAAPAHAAPSDPDALRSAFDAGRLQGRNEERQASQSLLAADRAAHLSHRSALLENFAREQERYLHLVEREVVELALAIAARILRREAQMDPLLLTGAVRVALGQLAEKTDVRLHVPEADADLWREAIAHLPNLAVRPEVITEPAWHLGECELETRLGTVDLGVRAQLGEIERGFFDRATRADVLQAAAASVESAA